MGTVRPRRRLINMVKVRVRESHSPVAESNCVAARQSGGELVGNCSQKGESFEFLGYRFETGRRFVRKKSLMSFRDKVRAKTKRSRSGSLKEITNDLNPMLRGWLFQTRPSLHV